MFLSLIEPQIDFNQRPIKNVFVPIKEYSILEFYENIWVDEVKNKRNKLLDLCNLNLYHHPFIRNYLELIKKRLFHIHLVKKYRHSDGNEYVILYTYLLNIFKRIWRNKRVRT